MWSVIYIYLFIYLFIIFLIICTLVGPHQPLAAPFNRLR